jgi:UDP-N-acetylmuramyl pentapeptide phosphotransferase/UDP-N-acetylglucosamine-1-phosphate transferase
VIGSLLVGAFVATAAPHHRNVFFGIAGTVFILWGVALLLIEVIALLARQAEKSRKALGEKGPGYAALLDAGFQDPKFRPRSRIMWKIELGVGVVALIAFFLR